MDVTKPVGVLISPSSTPPTRRVPLPEVRPNSSLPAGPRTAVNAFPSASPPAPSITPPAGPLSFEPLASHSATPPPPLGPAVGDVAPESERKAGKRRERSPSPVASTRPAPRRDDKRSKLTHLHPSDEHMDEKNVQRKLENENLFLSSRRIKSCIREAMPPSLEAARILVSDWVQANPYSQSSVDWNKHSRKVIAAPVQDIQMRAVSRYTPSSSATVPPDHLESDDPDSRILEDLSYIEEGMLKWHTVDAVDDEHPSSRLRFEGVPFQDELPIPARGQGFQFPDFTIRDGRVVGCCYKGNKPFNTQLGENVQAPLFLEGTPMSAGFDYLVSTCGRISGIVYVVTPVFLKMLQSPVIEAWSKHPSSKMMLWLDPNQAIQARPTLELLNSRFQILNDTPQRQYFALIVVALRERNWGANIHAKEWFGTTFDGQGCVTLMRSANPGVFGYGLATDDLGTPSRASLESSIDQESPFMADRAQAYLRLRESLLKSLRQSGQLLVNSPSTFTPTPASENRKAADKAHAASGAAASKLPDAYERMPPKSVPASLLGEPITMRGGRPTSDLFKGLAGSRPKKGRIHGRGYAACCGSTGNANLHPKNRYFTHPGGVAAATGPSCTPLILDGVHGIFLEGAGPEFDAKLARQALLVKKHTIIARERQDRRYFGPITTMYYTMVERKLSLPQTKSDLKNQLRAWIEEGRLSDGHISPSFNTDTPSDPLFAYTLALLDSCQWGPSSSTNALRGELSALLGEAFQCSAGEWSLLPDRLDAVDAATEQYARYAWPTSRKKYTAHSSQTAESGGRSGGPPPPDSDIVEGAGGVVQDAEWSDDSSSEEDFVERSEIEVE